MWLSQQTIESGESPIIRGTELLPRRTIGQICFTIKLEPKDFCVVTIKGPLGVPYRQIRIFRPRRIR